MWDQLQQKQPRLGNRSLNNAPRNTYQCADGTGVAISASSDSIASRVMRLVGAEELIDVPWFGTSEGRGALGDELDAPVAAWIGARTVDEVVAGFEEAHAAVAVIYDIESLMNDPHVREREIFTTVDDPDLGPVVMTNVLFGLSETPGAIRFTGRGHGADTDEVLGELGYSAEEISAMRANSSIA